MLAFVLTAVLAVLIILERMGKIRLSNLVCCSFMMISFSTLTGLYIVEFVKALIALCINVLDVKDEDLEEFIPLYEGMSTTTIIIKLVLLVTLAIPFVIGTIYIIQAIVRKPVRRKDSEADNCYNIRCGCRMMTLGVIAAVCFFVCLVITIIVCMPYIKIFIASTMLFHPLLVLIACIFSCGLGLIYLAGLFITVNAPFFVLLISFGLVAISFYGFSVILGIAGVVRARKAGVLTTGKAVVYGILSLMSGWNFIVFLILRKKLSDNLKTV